MIPHPRGSRKSFGNYDMKIAEFPDFFPLQVFGDVFCSESHYWFEKIWKLELS
jgi:hypothetical protein